MMKHLHLEKEISRIFFPHLIKIAKSERKYRQIDLEEAIDREKEEKHAR